VLPQAEGQQNLSWHRAAGKEEFTSGPANREHSSGLTVIRQVCWLIVA